MNRGLRVVVAILAMALPWRTVSARQTEDQREVQGRVLFAKGEYQAALDIYATLFAEKGDPLYLRNIGRCYQKLEQPEKAIDAFEEYLRRGHVKHAERTEVEGFIAEMQALEKQRKAAPPPPSPSVEPIRATTSAAPEPVAPPTSPPPPAAPEPAAGSTSESPPGATLTRQAATDQPESTPLTHRWWFWTGIGVLVAAGAVMAVVLTRSHGGVVPTCPSGVDGCQVP